MKNNVNQRTKTAKTDKKTLAVRIVAWVLLVMMVITGVYTTIYFLIEEVSAAEAEDLNIAVGLVYGSSCDVAFTTRTTTGFLVGSEVIELYNKTFTPLWTKIDSVKVTVLSDRNYGLKSTGSYYQTDEDVKVGAYQLELKEEFTDKILFSSTLESVNTALSSIGIYAIPAYVNGANKIRLGSYASESDAQTALNTVNQLLSGYSVSVAVPTSTCVTVVDHSTSKILFEYDCGNTSYLALEPIDGTDGTEAYLASPAGNIYDGVFVYKRYITSSKDGISLINVLPIEDYVMGVVPYEISNSWPIECVKAMAIIARTYVVSSMSKYWKSYGFNVCATANSQVYKGVARANANVIKAVTETAGLVMTYNGVLAPVFYSSSFGNCNADVRYVWGGTSYPWLESVSTPWEDYKNHSNAFWQAEVSPTDLQAALYQNGYKTLTAPIASVNITMYAGENSTYIYQLVIIDEEGHTATITRSDKVRSAFSAYVKSSNFVIGKGSVEYTTYTRTVPPASDVTTEANLGVFTVLTSLGKYTSSIGEDGVSVMTANGTYNNYVPSTGVSVLTSGSGGKINVELPDYIVTETAYASDSNNFIIVGKGWGHGVGYSQYGMYDLAIMGYSCDEILRAYCPSTETKNYKNIISY